MSVATPIAAISKLEVEGLSKRYGDALALEPTSLSVTEGEFLTLLGPSGSGKTTLLMMICGLVRPTAGKILIDGQDETHTPVHQRDIGLVFQHYALFPHMTVGENVGFPLKMRGVPKKELQQRVTEALEMVKMAHLTHRLPSELSGGQQQRVALARCFVYQPSIILMDEPLGALDKRLRQHLQIEIKELHRRTGATIIYVTHDQEEALAMSDRICLLNDAKVEQLGTPHEIYAAPTPPLRPILSVLPTSSMVWQQGENGEPTHITTQDHSFALPAHRFTQNDDIALVVRPEHMQLNDVQPNTIEGIVVNSIYAGTDTKVIVESEPYGLLTIRLDDRTHVPEDGTKVCVGWDPQCSVVVAP